MSTTGGKAPATHGRAATVGGRIASALAVVALGTLVIAPTSPSHPSLSMELRRAPLAEAAATTTSTAGGDRPSTTSTTTPTTTTGLERQRPSTGTTVERGARDDATPLLPEEVTSILGDTVWNGPATAGPTVGTHDEVSRVRVALRSSADWAALQLAPPAQVVNATLVDGSTQDLFWRADGVVVSARDGRLDDPAVVDMLLADHPLAAHRWKLLFPGGASGDLKATGINSPAQPVEVATVTSAQPGQVLVVDGRQVARHGPLSVGKADHEGLVLANYVPWHPDGDYERFNNRPADPAAATTDPAYVRRAIASARDAGIDGFMVSYFGLPHRDVDVYFDAARTVPGWRSALMLETKVANAHHTWREKPDPAVLETWIRDALHRFGDSPTLLRMNDGRAVFFAYRADLVAPEAWQRIVDRSAARGEPIAIIGSDMRASYLSALTGMFTYNSLVYDDLPAAYRLRSDLTRTDHLLHADRERKLWVATVTPGMNHTGPTLEPRVYDRKNGERYREQWQAALASGADWVLIVTWNDYAEETTIEASREWGDTYLRLTRQLAG